MATITGEGAVAALLVALSGGLDKPPSNWSEIDIRQPATQVSRSLDQRGDIVSSSAPALRRKIAPADFFRIVELAPKAIASPEARPEPPADAEQVLHIRTGDGKDYYFAGEPARFKEPSAQAISDILHRYP